jgi:hypothetical protein
MFRIIYSMFSTLKINLLVYALQINDALLETLRWSPAPNPRLAVVLGRRLYAVMPDVFPDHAIQLLAADHNSNLLLCDGGGLTAPQPRRSALATAQWCVLLLLCLTYNLLHAGLGHGRVVLAILDHDDMLVCPCET